MKKSVRTAFVLLNLLLQIFHINAQDGLLDSSFGNGGRVITDFGGFDVSFGIAVQPDGKILVCGAATGASNEGIVLRYLENGALDPDFGINGKAGIVAGSGGTSAYGISIQADGKILVTGETADSSNAGGSNIFLARLNSDGSLDTSFATLGIHRIFSDGFNDEGLALVVQPSGKIVLTGHQDHNNLSALVVFRFNTNGEPDQSFGINGEFSSNGASTGTTVSLGKNGAFMVVGQTPGIETTTLIAFQEDGSLQTGFGNNGILVLDLIPGSNKVERVFSSVINDDGTIMLGGDLGGFSAVRLLSNGSPDPSFGVGGIATASFPGNQYFLSQGVTCMMQPDGKVLLTGLLIDGHNDDFGILRFDKNGHIDPAFGADGWVVTDMTGTQDWCYASTIQSDNKLLLAGYSIGNQMIDILVARYNIEIGPVTPPPDTTVTEGSKPRLFPNPTFGKCTLEYSLRSSSTIFFDLFDASGRLLRNLLSEQDAVTGLKTKPFDITDVAGGVYILRLKIEEEEFFFQMVKLE